jgi:hypothetical protein
MNALWSYFWPLVAIGLLIGAIAGSIGFRAPRATEEQRDSALAAWRKKRRLTLAAGVLATLACAALWHGPLGGAGRFADRVETSTRDTLTYFEMISVTGKLHRAPLTRRIQLSGPADDFQRSELVRIIGGLPGVSTAHWRPMGGGTPLIAEGGLIAILGFLVGLLLAYLVELRRRYNAQWSW